MVRAVTVVAQTGTTRGVDSMSYLERRWESHRTHRLKTHPNPHGKLKLNRTLVSAYTGSAGAYVSLFIEDSILPSSADFAFWLLTTLVDGFVMYLFIRQGLFRRFIFLSLYFLLSVTISIARCIILLQFGLPSVEYVYGFYITDALLSISLFLSVSELSLRVGRIRMLRWKIVTWAGSLLLTMACFGVESLRSNGVRTPIFLSESSQSIFFICGLAVILLWVWKFLKNPVDGVAAKFLNVFGVYFLVFFLVYGAREISFSSAVATLYALQWMMGAWLPLGCGFALVSQEPTIRV